METNTGKWNRAVTPWVWIPTGSVTIGTLPTFTTLTDYYFEGVRSVAIYDSDVYSILLKESSVNLYNCFASNIGPNFTIDVDTASALVAHELRYYASVNESIFVNSISYDGTGDILDPVLNPPSIPTSVWGPLRSVFQSGNNNVVSGYSFDDDFVCWAMESYPAGSGLGTCCALTDAGIMKNVVSGSTLQSLCAELILSPGQINYFDWLKFRPADGKYYFWSIHAHQCGNIDDGVSGYIGAEPAGAYEQLGQVILKPNQWVCSYGVKKYTGSSPDYTLWFSGNASGGTIRFCHYQVVEFDNYYDAVSFMNSRAYAVRGRLCGEEGDFKADSQPVNPLE